jgi:hypothetical protein
LIGSVSSAASAVPVCPDAWRLVVAADEVVVDDCVAVVVGAVAVGAVVVDVDELVVVAATEVVTAELPDPQPMTPSTVTTATTHVMTSTRLERPRNQRHPFPAMSRSYVSGFSDSRGLFSWRVVSLCPASPGFAALSATPAASFRGTCQSFDAVYRVHTAHAVTLIVLLPPNAFEAPALQALSLVGPEWLSTAPSPDVNAPPPNSTVPAGHLAREEGVLSPGCAWS